MTAKDIIGALKIIAPNTQWNLSGDDLSGFVWLDLIQPRPTDAAIIAQIGA